MFTSASFEPTSESTVKSRAKSAMSSSLRSRGISIVLKLTAIVCYTGSGNTGAGVAGINGSATGANYGVYAANASGDSASKVIRTSSRGMKRYPETRG